MPATPFDSPIWRNVFHDAEIAPLFTDTAVLRAELLVMGTLALTQAKAGTVPDICAEAIQRAGMEVQIDPAALNKVTAETGDPVLALVQQFQSEMQAPEFAKWVHHDSHPALTAATALALRLRQVLSIFASRLNPDSQSAAYLERMKPHVLLAYHDDATTRAGLARGLGLGDAGNTATPAQAMVLVAQWALDTAEMAAPHTPAQYAAAQLVTHLCQPLLSAGDSPADRLLVAMCLPQICLGLSVLVPPTTGLAN